MKLELRTSKCIKGSNKGKWGLILYSRGRSMSVSPCVFETEEKAIDAGKAINFTIEPCFEPHPHQA
jgi:hypothetical protein